MAGRGRAGTRLFAQAPAARQLEQGRGRRPESIEPSHINDGPSKPPFLARQTDRNDLGHKRAKRGRSGAVRPVNCGLTRTTAVKIKNRYGQVSDHFHAQTRTCHASLPSWICRFDPGRPLHRKTLTQQGFSRAHGPRVLLRRGPCVPSGAVCTTPPRQLPVTGEPAAGPRAMDPGRHGSPTQRGDPHPRAHRTQGCTDRCRDRRPPIGAGRGSQRQRHLRLSGERQPRVQGGNPPPR